MFLFSSDGAHHTGTIDFASVSPFPVKVKQLTIDSHPSLCPQKSLQIDYPHNFYLSGHPQQLRLPIFLKSIYITWSYNLMFLWHS